MVVDFQDSRSWRSVCITKAWRALSDVNQLDADRGTAERALHYRRFSGPPRIHPCELRVQLRNELRVSAMRISVMQGTQAYLDHLALADVIDALQESR